MAMNDVTICNLALSHVGADALLSSINPPDGSVESGFCARFYPVARQELIETFPWTFAKTRVSLSALSTNPSAAWAYAYAAPSNMLRPKRVLPATTVEVTEEAGTATFEVEDGVLLTNVENAVLLYVRDVTDTSKFTPGFTAALSYLLASYLAGPLIKGSTGADAAASLHKVAMLKAKDAFASNANSSVEISEFEPSGLGARK